MSEHYHHCVFAHHDVERCYAPACATPLEPGQRYVWGRSRPCSICRAKPVATVRYTNHRGETATRKILPLTAPYYGTTVHHPEPQWLLEVWDHDKAAMRTFALRDVMWV